MLYPFIGYVCAIVNDPKSNVTKTVNELGSLISKHMVELHFGGLVPENIETIEAFEISNKKTT